MGPQGADLQKLDGKLNTLLQASGGKIWKLQRILMLMEIKVHLAKTVNGWRNTGKILGDLIDQEDFVNSIACVALETYIWRVAFLVGGRSLL